MTSERAIVLFPCTSYPKGEVCMRPLPRESSTFLAAEMIRARQRRTLPMRLKILLLGQWKGLELADD